MKIDKSVEIQPAQDAVLRSGHSAGPKRPGVRPDAQPRAVGGADSVNLSAASRRLGAAGDNAEVRPERVAEIQKAIRSNCFHVRAEVVADRMIAQAAELLETLATTGQ